MNTTGLQGASMTQTTLPAAGLSGTYAGCVTLTAESRADARLLGILSRLIGCGATTREGLEVLLEIVTEKAKQPRSGGREK